MQPQHSYSQNLFNKIQNLPPEKIAVIEDFVEFISHRDDDALLTKSSGKIAEETFKQVWDNPEDADYDNL